MRVLAPALGSRIQPAIRTSMGNSRKVQPKLLSKCSRLKSERRGLWMYLRHGDFKGTASLWAKTFVMT